jgi:hypothetical protein
MYSASTTYGLPAQPFDNTGLHAATPRTYNPTNHVSQRRPSRTHHRMAKAASHPGFNAMQNLSLSASPRTPQAQMSTPSTNPTQETPQPHVEIGTILSNGDATQDRYKCRYQSCSHKSFGRIAELRRHNLTKHSSGDRKPQFWCPVDECERSRSGMGEAFPRLDKMLDHRARMHGGGGGS